MSKDIDYDKVHMEFGAFYEASRHLCDAEELIPEWNELPEIVQHAFVYDVLQSGLSVLIATVLDRMRLIHSGQVN